MSYEKLKTLIIIIIIYTRQSICGDCIPSYVRINIRAIKNDLQF